MSEVDQTRHTYAQIARAYAQANAARDKIQQQLNLFLQQVPRGSRVLDLGCGPGFDADWLRRTGLNVVGLDLSVAMMRAGWERGLIFPGVQADLRRLPMANASITGAWACASLLHLPHREMGQTLLEVARVLVPGGLFYLSVKVGTREKWSSESYNRPLPRFFAYWQPETLDPLLQAANFQISDGWIDGGWLVRFARLLPSAV